MGTYMARRLVARFSPLSRLGTPPSPRSSHGVSVHNSMLYVVGGEGEARKPIDMAVHILPLQDPAAEWRKVEHDESSPPVRFGHAQAVAGGKLMLFGGRAGTQMEEAILDDLWSFDFGSESWAPVQSSSGSAPSPRSYHAATAVGDKLYLFGGCGVSGRMSDLHEFCTSSNTWRRLPDAPVSGRGGAALESSSDGTGLWLLGGFDGGETRDLLRYDIATAEWKAHPADWLRPRSVTASFSLSGSILAFGGEVEPSAEGHEGAGAFADDMVAIDSSTGEQLPVSVISQAADRSLPEARGWGGAAAVSGSQAVLFGGLAGSDEAPRRLEDGWQVTLKLQAARPW